MFTLPLELQAKILRELSLDEKCKLFSMEEFADILTSKCAWKTLPRISLQRLKIVSALYVLSSGLYLHKDKGPIVEALVNKSNGTIIIKCFSKYYSLQNERSTVYYNLDEVAQFLSDIKENYRSIDSDIYLLPDGKKIYFKKNWMKNAPKNTLIELTEDQPKKYILKYGRFIYFIIVYSENPVEWQCFLNSLCRYIKIRAKYIEFDSFKIYQIKHWTSEYKLCMKAKYTLLSRKKIVKAMCLF